MPVNWNELMNLVAPVVGEVATHGQRGSFLEGFMRAQQRSELKKQQDADVLQKRKAVGADYLLKIGEHAQGLTDPTDFENFLNLAEHAGTQAGYLQPGDLRNTIKYNGAKQADAQLKELTDQLAQLEKGGYDTDQLAQSGAQLHLKSGKTIPISTALDLTRQRPLDASGNTVPRPKKADAVGTIDERAARLVAQIRTAKTTDPTKAAALQAEYDDLIKAKTDLNTAGRTPVDSEIAGMNKTLKDLQIQAARQNIANGGTGANEPIQADDIQGAAAAILAGRMAPSQLSLVGGMGNRGVKFKQAVVAAVNKQDPAFNWQASEAGYKFAANTGTQNTVRYMKSVQESMPRLLASSQKLANGNVRAVNALVNAGKNQFNDVDLKAFQTDVLLVADEVAKILQGGGTGSGTSDAKLRQASEILSTSDSPAAIASALREVNTLIGFRQASLTEGTFLEKKTPPAGETPKLTYDPATGTVK